MGQQVQSPRGDELGMFQGLKEPHRYGRARGRGQGKQRARRKPNELDPVALVRGSAFIASKARSNWRALRSRATRSDFRVKISLRQLGWEGNVGDKSRGKKTHGRLLLQSQGQDGGLDGEEGEGTGWIQTISGT